MYTATVGRTFLDEYNRRNQTNLSAKEFFDEVLFSVIFDHPKYLMWVQNSPFVQGLGKKKPFFNADERVERLEKLHEKITGGATDASIALGFPASDDEKFATTSGLVSFEDLPVEAEDVYCSWIGAALSVGVAGGYTILFNDPNVSYQVFEGWQKYRELLQDSVLQNKIPSNKLSTWNGQWLWFRNNEDEYFPEFRFADLVRLESIFSIEPKEIAINTVPWSRLFFALSSSYSGKSMMAYVSSLGQTNKTVGFIPMKLQTGDFIHQVYQKLFGMDNYQINKKEFESLFGKHIKRACELGSIGLQALEPKNLRKYFGNDSNLKLAKPKVSRKKTDSDEEYQEKVEKAHAKDHQNIITFHVYKTWLIAMIAKNKTEISDYTREIAKALMEFRENSRGTKGKNLLDKLFANKRKENFLEYLTELINSEGSSKEIADQMNLLRDRVHFMNREDFTYFVALLKFDYAYQERIS
ncbi:hypothetical protein [Pontibacter sp. G13]|uniref:hypothetical protein n=1 Tax=Pontibacter sp. G13 TaxID=3074898 RepID=UPI00288A2314|nr:hypothetical protein [Pontibacter sp. G13]WNJ20034.1 hypothetical protein RJD25_06080 [Pontibacter sp. G13]